MTTNSSLTSPTKVWNGYGTSHFQGFHAMYYMHGADRR